MFLEKRVYQGSSGRVYPLPVIDRIESDPQDQFWNAIHIENEYVRFMILPEMGGRIHVGLDKLNGYDFFYRQNVIKPALVGLAGPWVSGGVEFNWPQHHRPATYMPVHCAIERDADGSVTVWCSDHDPMARMKGMHGIRLRPGKAVLEVRVRLYNRTIDTQTFLWWANVATHVHEHYQSFFPRDVRYVADHARRAITEFPLSQGSYYGVNYGRRDQHGIPENERPSQFIPDGSYPSNDLSRYANISVPTSYMVVHSTGDFAGGYDHRRRAGLVQVANHHISPGKKQWTWGNHEFGYAWDRCLTESDGPYIELMSGVYTDNQPDFSYLAPGETKTFSQYWYPIREIGVPDQATIDAAVRTERTGDGIRIHLLVTSARPQSTLRILVDGQEAAAWTGDLHPEALLHQTFSIPEGKLELRLEQAGQILLRYAPDEIVPGSKPQIASEPPSPEDVATSDELFLIGLHLEQYRHPTREPEIYWQEALRRDPGDSRANAALGRMRLRHGEFGIAERFLRTAIARLTERNSNPADGEPYYNLGLTLSYLGRTMESYAAFYKSTWNAAWRGPAFHRLAEIDCGRHDWPAALELIERSLRADADNLGALNLKCVLLRKLGRNAEAAEFLATTRALDPLDIFGAFLESGEIPHDGQERLDLIFDMLRASLLEDALAIASAPVANLNDGSAPVLLYAKADILARLNRDAESAVAYRQAATASPDYVFPSRVEEMLLLQRAIERNGQDARAPYYLGNLLYDRRRHREAIALWERAAQLDPSFPVTWRNLGFGYYNVLHDAIRASDAFSHARAMAPQDARVLFEYDQLQKKTGASIHDRLADLESNLDLVEKRDDLSVELVTLYNSAAKPERALALLAKHQFQPWEGGEGLVLGQYVRARILLSQEALRRKDTNAALWALEQALNPPQNLGEARHPLMNMSVIDYWLGVSYDGNGAADQASYFWNRAARAEGDFREMSVQPISEMSYWSAMALRRLRCLEEADALFQKIFEYACELERHTPTVDYFATSLPALLLFDEDLKQRQRITATFLKAQAIIGMGKQEEGVALLRQVLLLDQSHAGAIDLLREQNR